LLFMCIGIKSTNRMQQLHDFNVVCYDKVLSQVRNGQQVGWRINSTCIKYANWKPKFGNQLNEFLEF